ncbi:hypothetical protein CapIbe_007590 [Capra ibex]
MTVIRLTAAPKARHVSAHWTPGVRILNAPFPRPAPGGALRRGRGPRRGQHQRRGPPSHPSRSGGGTLPDSWLGQPRPGVHGLRRSSQGIPPAFASPHGVGNAAASPRGLTGISTLFGGSPEGPRFPQQQLRPTSPRRNRPPCRTSNPGRRVGS